ncbi:hypothetical protein CEXT_139431 [Caerostris extrusa]|uniref:Uncharacterized protein n=1 Tax=Caerostris extrusa TaxID=172846 RepID=A0AAV4NS57_CAEEX|nr:hypothetical protein CEXT_139431 [Caerostris extrusa]
MSKIRRMVVDESYSSILRFSLPSAFLNTMPKELWCISNIGSKLNYSEENQDPANVINVKNSIIIANSVQETLDASNALDLLPPKNAPSDEAP